MAVGLRKFYFEKLLDSLHHIRLVLDSRSVTGLKIHPLLS